MTGRNQQIETDQFVRLLTQNERRVYAFILSLVPNWADADEILQETNVRLWQDFEKYEPGTDFAAWACTVAKFQIMTYRKKRAREQVQFSNEFIEKVAAEAAATMAVTDERRDALNDCILKLSDKNQSLLRACYSPGSKIKDVAAQFGRSVDAVYKALSRVRQFLHICIDKSLEQEHTS